MYEPPRPTDPTPASPNPQPPASSAFPHHGVTESPAELRQRQVHESEQHDDAKSAAVGAAVGLGCLSLAFLPWLVGFFLFALILVVGFVMHAHIHH